MITSMQRHSDDIGFPGHQCNKIRTIQCLGDYSLSFSSLHVSHPLQSRFRCNHPSSCYRRRHPPSFQSIFRQPIKNSILINDPHHLHFASVFLTIRSKAVIHKITLPSFISAGQPLNLIKFLTPLILSLFLLRLLSLSRTHALTTPPPAGGLSLLLSLSIIVQIGASLSSSDMEDDEEIQSHPAGGTGSPASPRPNGRITVTVAAVPPTQNTLALALPIRQQPRQTGSSGGGGREDCWSEGATGVLIDAWGERYLELSRGNLKQKHWKDVADIVSSREDYTKTPKTDIQCKNRIDTVKKKYKLEKAKIAAGGGPSKWPFFERLDQLIGPSAKLNSVAGGPSRSVPYSGSQRVPMGIPMGVGSAPQFRQQDKSPQQQRQKQKQQFRKLPPPVDSDEESEPEASPDSGDDFPPERHERKRPRVQPERMNLGGGVKPGPGMDRGRDGGAAGRVGEKKWGNSVRGLTRAILKFGEAYEQAESSKLQQLVDMEKQRMQFAKELELQRMQFFMKTQLELSQFKSRRRVGNSNKHHSNKNATNNNNNNSDSSN